MWVAAFSVTQWNSSDEGSPHRQPLPINDNTDQRGSDEDKSWTSEELWFDYRRQDEISLFSSVQTVHSSSHLFHGCPGSPAVKRPGRESNHSPLSSSEVKNERSCTATASRAFTASTGLSVHARRHVAIIIHVPVCTESAIPVCEQPGCTVIARRSAHRIDLLSLHSVARTGRTKRKTRKHCH